MSEPKMFKETVIAPLKLETAAFAKAAEPLNIPPEDKRQPDLQYMAAVFVSSGMNKNGAVFLGSELVKAHNTVNFKAVDIEHEETSIVGHILESAYITRDGDVFDAETASTEMSIKEMDETEMDIAISTVIYKTRFPELAEEIRSGEWMVSMEAYYRDYDIKVGDMIIPKDEALALGYDKLVGSVVQVCDGDKELGFHLVGRVLRGILFSGVGLVKNPANDRSVIYEAAAIDEFVKEHAAEKSATINIADIKDLDAASKENIVNANEANLNKTIESFKNDIVSELDGIKKLIVLKEEHAKTNYPGTCVSYKRYLYDAPTAEDDDLPEPSTNTTQYPQADHPGGAGETKDHKVVAEHWCTLFDRECSSRPGDATHPSCWRNVLNRVVKEEVQSYEDLLWEERFNALMSELSSSLTSVDKYLGKK